MQSEIPTIWTSFHATLGQSSANPVFNQANPGGAPQSGTSSTTAPGGTAPAGNAPGSPFGFMLPLIVVFGGMILLQVFMGRKQEKKRRELLNGIKKHDKVVAAGGIVGVVAEVRDDEVVLKIDDNSNAKIRVLRSAVQQILRPSNETDASKTAPEIVDAKSKGELSAKN